MLGCVSNVRDLRVDLRGRLAWETCVWTGVCRVVCEKRVLVGLCACRLVCVCRLVGLCACRLVCVCRLESVCRLAE